MADHSDTESSSTLLAPTGVPGLDHVIPGGLPRNRIYLVEGDPGVGKTTLGIQFLLEGVRRGERVLYITLSESRDELLAVADSHGWDLSKVDIFELSAVEEKLRAENENTFFHPSEVELTKTAQVVMAEVERRHPERVVFDSLSELRLLAETPLRYRRQMLGLKQFFSGRACTALFLDDLTADVKDLQVRSLSHGVITLLKSSPAYGISRRSLNVEKVRGVHFREGYHDFSIRKGGVVIFPRLVAAEHLRDFPTEIFPSGNAAIDSLLGGGLHRGTSSMFMGPPGTGKSTLALRYACTAAEKGEGVSYFIFDETLRSLVDRSKALGMDIGPHIEAGLIQVRQIDPAEISPGELTDLIRIAVEEHSTRMVIVDSINGYLNAMPDERYLNLQLHELLAFLNQQGVISILIYAQQGLIGSIRSAVDLTYLADCVVLHRFFEARGELKQAVSVIKKRSGSHERSIRELKVEKEGLVVGEPLRAFQGILTGVPTLGDTFDEDID